MSEKTMGEKLQEQLLDTPKNGYDRIDDATQAAIQEFSEGYKAFLDNGKTEGEVVEYTIAMLKEHGYEEYQLGKKYGPGDKLYLNNRGKALAFVTMGTKPLSEGVKMVASHIDSPRIDMKPHPLYEDTQTAFFKTHYYGGLRKYQWVVMPLALHGVVVKKDGTQVKIHIGDDEGDPVFVINDLLPHLAQQQSQRTLAEGIKGEELNIVVGGCPFKDDKVSQRVKLAIAKILFDKYSIVESDFVTAEITAVPAFGARDVGFDRSFVGGYGQDDRVCAYTSLIAALESPNPTYTTVTVFADREEIGSCGNTGMKSAYLKHFLADLAAPYGIPVRNILDSSECLSSDVAAAVDPTFPDVTEKYNSAYMNYGVSIEKYTGSRGKSGTSEASAVFFAKLRKLFDDAGVVWQTGELGKVDQGGGGTVAVYLAEENMDVIDVGVPVWSMHAPFEVTSKLDIYMAYRAYVTFLNMKD